MTFIASVVARNGVAIIADSLVTATKPILDYDDFKKYVQSKKKVDEASQGIKLDSDELIDLFKIKPSYTKDYEDKLVEYDKYLAVTTAGTARINDKRISEIVESIKSKHHIRGYGQQKIETKIKRFCGFLKDEVIEHLSKNPAIGRTSFIFTHFNRKSRKITIYRVWVNSSSKNDLENKKYKFVDYMLCYDHEKVVSDGQNRITTEILYGDFEKVFELVPKVVEKVASDLKPLKKQVTDDYKKKVINYFLPPVDAINLMKLTELSLQQAVELANLLMTLEIDIQKYTKEIPTVGGVVKIAIIDKNGFRFICGDEIEKPGGL